MNYPTSDIQFVAAMLRKVRAGDQVTSTESHRLDQLAARGYSDEPMGVPGMPGQIPDGMTAEEVASATRVETPIDRRG